jgi:hypothetical protein
MSQEQPMQGPALAQRPKITIKVDQLKRAAGLSVIGLPELIGLAGAAFLALITLFAYFYFYLPAQARYRSTQKQVEQLQSQMGPLQKLSIDTETISEGVKLRTSSVKEFESNWLAVAGPGRLSLYTELNNLIRSNGLRNTAGPSYTSLDPIGSKVQGVTGAEKQGIAKWQSIYPGIAVSVTVEGAYQNVRHFVRDIESSRHFLIINAVELEGVTKSGADFTAETPVIKPQTKPARPGAARPEIGAAPLVTPTPGGRGSLVSLRLDMATYFQRPEAKSASEPAK